MRAHDESEALRIKELHDASHHSPILWKIENSRNLAELGDVPGWHYNARENYLTCDHCFRYASFAPGTLRGGVKSAGTLEGSCNGHDGTPRGRGARPFAMVKFKQKAHVQGLLHEWCATHAIEEAKLLDARRSAGLHLGKLVLAQVLTARVLITLMKY